MAPLDQLKGLLCGPDGNVVIHGTDEDRRLCQQALDQLEIELDKLHNMVGEQFKAQGNAAVDTVRVTSESKRLRVSDLAFYAGPSHQDTVIKLNIHGSKNTAYAYIPNRFASILRNENEVVIDVQLDRYDLRLKQGKRL